ncbi:hypothetical protein BCR41DRAFT_400267 [Lobosporangium transversale]|uniref:Uncharacterized protein n=1 Tax=Lobosporangium transversale TaxID=64571 RepID=A0A1Y2GB74_9FUNG|nr:hypothetical protein BCR41DRAFT_400267 [Lobosporangium transversale]ORZ06127.1 hypothetical protein BCR41DRAFT_400267 [Lobosporangium transversale]|eukprot:XP_021877396.1 hypothetical protein BCR41DRAFT_400267 [Lobosporangium transversale]
MDERGIPDTDRIEEFGVQMAPKKRELRKAQRATSDYAVQQVLKMLGGIGVLAVGLGPLESSKGVPSKHTAITKQLVTQHEDTPLAESIARIGLAQVKSQESPANYKPMEESPAFPANRARH